MGGRCLFRGLCGGMILAFYLSCPGLGQGSEASLRQDVQPQMVESRPTGEPAETDEIPLEWIEAILQDREILESMELLDNLELFEEENLFSSHRFE